MGLDPGPELPPLPGQQRAGEVSEARDIEVEGHRYGASPNRDRPQHALLPRRHGRRTARPARLVLRAVVEPALVAGAWGVGSALLFSSLFSGMSGSRTSTGSPTAWRPTGSTAVASTAAASTAAATRAATPAAVTRGGDFGGGDFGGGDFGGGDWGGGGNDWF